MYVAVLVAGLFLGTAFCRDQSVTIDSGSCGQEFTLDDDDKLRVYYNGASLPYTCKITINTDDYSKDICTNPKTFELNSCAATIQYHDYSYSSTYSYDEEYTCSSKQYGQYCTLASSLVIAVDKNGAGSFNNGDNVELKVTLKDSSEGDYRDDSAETAVYMFIGIIVGGVVLLFILSIVVIICCCRRQQNRAGTVYRAPGQGTTVTTSVGYSMTDQQQTGYGQPGFQQPPPAGYQQPPPAGYQQPPPAGYQQPPSAGYQQPPPAGFQQPPGYQQQAAGYPPAAQQGYAGFQTGPNAPITDKASAPPMEYPPPYS